LHELAEFGDIVLVEWGDVAAAALGDHLEVRLSPDVEDEVAVTGSDDQADDFGLEGARTIELNPTGRTWADRWNLVTDGLAAYGC